MPDRKKILILEKDDFLREIIGNLLHKKGYYILNGFCIQNGLEEAKNKHIHNVILGTSCKDFQGKKSINYIKKNLTTEDFFVLNDTDKEISWIEEEKQMKISNLSIKKIIDYFNQKPL